MTKEQTGKLIYAMSTLYMSHFKKSTSADLMEMTQAWNVVLADLNYEDAMQGLKLFAMTDEGFPPTVAQIRKKTEEYLRKKDTAKILKYLCLDDQIEANVGKDFLRLEKKGLTDAG